MRRRVGLVLVVLALAAGGYAYAAQEINGGLLRWLINGVRQPSGVAEINCKSDAGACYRDGGVATIDLDRVGGGGSANNPAGCSPNQITVAADEGGAPKCTLSSVDNTGSISMPSGSTINGLDPEAAKTKLDGLPSRTITTAEYKAGTQDWDYCFDAVVQTTNANATVFYRVLYRASEQVHFKYQCSAAQLDGGTLIGAKYSREAFVTSQDGGVTGSIVGGVDTVGTDREQDTSWGGPNAVQFDGGLGDGGPSYIIAELSLQGVTGEPTITWYCSGCWKKTPRSDSGIP